MDIFGLKSALGGTLRQCLCVKESLDFDNTDFVDLGSLSWSRYSVGVGYVLTAEVSNIKSHSDASTIANILCSKYKSAKWQDVYNQNAEKCIALDNKLLRVQDSTYTDATTFKAAMKGVLLAYEKA